MFDFYAWFKFRDLKLEICIKTAKTQKSSIFSAKLLFSEWSIWSECSSTCIGGRRSRTRSHPCFDRLDTEVQNCGTVGDYLPWY